MESLAGRRSLEWNFIARLQRAMLDMRILKVLAVGVEMRAVR